MKVSKCEYCGKLVEYPLPVHKVCALEWLIKEHEERPPRGDWAILVSAKDYAEALGRVGANK